MELGKYGICILFIKGQISLMGKYILVKPNKPLKKDGQMEKDTEEVQSFMQQFKNMEQRIFLMKFLKKI